MKWLLTLILLTGCCSQSTNSSLHYYKKTKVGYIDESTLYIVDIDGHKYYMTYDYSFGPEMPQDVEKKQAAEYTKIIDKDGRVLYLKDMIFSKDENGQKVFYEPREKEKVEKN